MSIVNLKGKFSHGIWVLNSTLDGHRVASTWISTPPNRLLARSRACTKSASIGNGFFNTVYKAELWIEVRLRKFQCTFGICIERGWSITSHTSFLQKPAMQFIYLPLTSSTRRSRSPGKAKTPCSKESVDCRVVDSSWSRLISEGKFTFQSVPM